MGRILMSRWAAQLRISVWHLLMNLKNNYLLKMNCLTYQVTPCSHFPDTCHFETIFVSDRFCVHTTLVLSAAQIETIPLLSKKWSRVISKCICKV